MTVDVRADARSVVRTSHGRVRIAVAYGVGAACAMWALWLARESGLLEHVRMLRWDLVAAAVAVDVLAYACQGLRWSLLMPSNARLTWLDSTRAIYIGLFASELLPLRPGEAVRAWLTARKLRISVASVVPSMLVERLFDGLWLMAGLGITALFVALPQKLVHFLRALGVVLLLALCGLTYLVLRSSATESAVAQRETTRRSRVRAALHEIAAGLRAIGHSGATALALGVSLLFLVGQIVAFWLTLHAYSVAAPFWTASAVLLIVHLGTAVPNAPGNAGTFQVFTILGLSLFGVSQETAAGFSLVSFVVLTVPLWILGALISGSGTLEP